MKVLGLIPARGGSKALPGKNALPLAGKSLVQRAFESALASGALDRIILSTDDRAIADAAESYGLEAPFLRPDAYAQDESPMIDVAVHALSELKTGGYHPDALFLLQPTSPLRTSEHIHEAVRLLETFDADSVCSVIPLPKGQCPHYLMKLTDDGFLDYFMPDGAKFTRRQDVPQAYRRDGTIYLTRTDVILEQRSFYGGKSVPMFISESESLNIDDKDDWDAAVRRLS